MKRTLSLIFAVLIVLAFGIFALASSSSSDEKSQAEQKDSYSETKDQGNDQAESAEEKTSSTKLHTVSVEIKSCRIAEDYEGSPVAIVTYVFTNNRSEAQSFWLTVKDSAFQDGVGLNDALFLAKSANYDDESYLKEVKKGASIEVERAYKLNDTTTDLEIEVKENTFLDDTTIRKVFTISD